MEYVVSCGFLIAPALFSLLSQVLDKHKAVDSMVELLQVYPEEDEAYGELLEATTQLYHYLLQPFRDMRELAMLRRQQIKVTHREIHTHTQIQMPSVSGFDLGRFRPHRSCLTSLEDTLTCVRLHL